MRNSSRIAKRVKRRGAAAVETALVLGIFLILLFGVFEYCRFLMVLHVANNAARDASRYATVNVGSDVLTRQDIQNYATARMGGADQNIRGYQVAVYPCSVSGFALIPKSLSSSS